MSPSSEAALSAQLRALRVDPPDAGFSARLRENLEGAAPASEGGKVVPIRRFRGNRTTLMFLVAASVFVATGAAALVGPQGVTRIVASVVSEVSTWVSSQPEKPRPPVPGSRRATRTPLEGSAGVLAPPLVPQPVEVVRVASEGNEPTAEPSAAPAKATQNRAVRAAVRRVPPSSAPARPAARKTSTPAASPRRLESTEARRAIIPRLRAKVPPTDRSEGRRPGAGPRRAAGTEARRHRPAPDAVRASRSAPTKREGSVEARRRLQRQQMNRRRRVERQRRQQLRQQVREQRHKR